MDFESVIGLEVHAQLRTDTKIFCGCSTAFGAPANSQVCPVCLGLPGALPVLNDRAVEYAVRAGLALGCTVHETSVFARKNYFYPDLPKGYQISQYEQPLAADGLVEYVVDGTMHRVRITRVHMEEDAGKSIHEGFLDSGRKTYVDYNRSGVPLIEIVTEPDLRFPAAASIFFKHLRRILLSIGVSDGNMEEGSLRCDANVSVRPFGENKLGVKVEVKNLNSFRFLEKAIEHEISRQTKSVRNGDRIVQETRLWDSASGRTVSMRSKEEAHDYRYFPEPDLSPLKIDLARCNQIKDELPELPEARKRRFMSDYGLSEFKAGFLSVEHETAAYYEAAVATSRNAKAAANWIIGPVTHKAKSVGLENWKIVSANSLAELIGLVDDGVITGVIAKDVFDVMAETGENARAIVKDRNLSQIEDMQALEVVVKQTLAENVAAVEKYKLGKTGALGFLVGQAMRLTKGKANPQLVNKLLKIALDG